MERPSFQFVDGRTVRNEAGITYDVMAAIQELPWVRQLCPLMPHAYAILQKSPAEAWFVVEAMIRLNPDSYRAYFRGYQSANRYWDAPDGLRYWRGRFEIDRCAPDSVEPPRRVNDGAKAIKDWDGPPWAPNGSNLYIQTPDGKWWPTRQAIASGHIPCRACRRRPPGIEGASLHPFARGLGRIYSKSS
jgi:hypothetical protein